MRAETPNGWRRIKLGEIARERRERADGVQPEVYSVTKYDGFVRSADYFDRQVFSRDVSRYRLVRRGDFAYATIHLDEGSLGLFEAADTGLISPMYTVFEADTSQVDPAFLFAYLKQPSMVQKYGRLGDGTVHRRKSIRFTTLGRTEIDLPPIEEQRAIAAVLGVIDEAIEGAQAEIKATEEFRRALLDELLTRGVPGWHSEWKHVPVVGTVPACWETTTIGTCLRSIEAGRSPLCEMRPALEDEWGVVKVSSVSSGAFRPDENKALLPDVEPESRFEIHEGDLLLSRANTPDLVGRAVLVRSTRGRLLLSDKTLRLVPDPSRATAEFLALTLARPSTRSQISSAASGSSRSMFNVSQRSLQQVLVGMPGLHEQRRIGEILEAPAALEETARSEASARQATRVALADALLTGRVRAGGGFGAIS